MNALDLLRTLRAHGVTLTPYPDDTLRYRAPQGTLTPALLAGIRNHKAVLLDLVERYEERCAILEYCGGLARQSAEALAWTLLLAEEETRDAL